MSDVGAIARWLLAAPVPPCMVCVDRARYALGRQKIGRATSRRDNRSIQFGGLCRGGSRRRHLVGSGWRHPDGPALPRGHVVESCRPAHSRRRLWARRHDQERRFDVAGASTRPCGRRESPWVSWRLRNRWRPDPKNRIRSWSHSDRWPRQWQCLLVRGGRRKADANRATRRTTTGIRGPLL